MPWVPFRASCPNGRPTVSYRESGSTTGDKNKTATIKEGCKEKERRANSMKPPGRIIPQQLHQFHSKHREWLGTMLCRPFSCLLRVFSFSFFYFLFFCMPAFINIFWNVLLYQTHLCFQKPPVLFYAQFFFFLCNYWEFGFALVLLIWDRRSCSVGRLMLI